MTEAEVAREIDDAIRHALNAGPAIVEACLQQHPALQQAQAGFPKRTR